MDRNTNTLVRQLIGDPGFRKMIKAITSLPSQETRSSTMKTQIHVYSEVRHKQQWTATARETYTEDPPSRFGWIKVTMKGVSCPEDYSFYGLLVKGARSSWPWSFEQRGMPEDVSEEIRNVCDSFGIDSYGHSHLTLKDLVEKYLELMVSGLQAKPQMVYLRQLIQSLSELSADHTDIRIVFWFDN